MLILIYFIRRVIDLKFEFLQPILAKIELICQQPTMSQLSGVHPSTGMQERMAGGSQGGLAMRRVKEVNSCTTLKFLN